MSETLEDTAPRRRRTGVTRKRREPRVGPVRQNGVAIAVIRELSGWSQNKFAAYVGISQPALSLIENEQVNAEDTTINLIASKSGIPVEAIRSRTAPCAACAARAAASEDAGPATAA